jgi:hypothetical protein
MAPWPLMPRKRPEAYRPYGFSPDGTYS